MTFSSYESVQGVPALRFRVPEEILANNSANAGFCLPEGNCLGSGVLNVSVCKNGKCSGSRRGAEGSGLDGECSLSARLVGIMREDLLE